MSDTPRTDEGCGDIFGGVCFCEVPIHGDYVRVELCRTLERELNAFVRLVLGDEATLTPSGNVVLAVAKLKSDLEDLARIRAGGCARDQRTTQFCAEAVELERKLDAWKEYAGRLEEAGNKMHWAFMHPFDVSHEMLVLRRWTAAKETKP